MVRPDLLGKGALGAAVVFLILLVVATGIWMRSRLEPVGSHNVNDDWAGASDRREMEPSHG